MTPGDRAWIALGVGVLAWDVFGPEMLSEASRRYVRSRPVIWHTLIIYLAGHLCHRWPARYDPLTQIARTYSH